MRNPTLSHRSIHFPLLLALLIACAGDPFDTVARSPKGRANDCIEGCLGSDLDISFITTSYYLPLGASMHGDTLYVPDSTYYLPGQAAAFFSVGPNPSDSAIVVGMSFGTSCSNSCIFPTTLGEPVADSLAIDASSTAIAYATFQTGAPGSGTIFFSAGAGEADVPVVVYHCTYRPTCG